MKLRDIIGLLIMFISLTTIIWSCEKPIKKEIIPQGMDSLYVNEMIKSPLQSYPLFDGIVKRSEKSWDRSATYKKVLIENHIYIEYWMDEGIVHDPECPKCKKVFEETMRKLIREELKNLKNDTTRNN